MKVFCTKCGGKDIHQEASIMVEINKETIVPNLDDFFWEDHYYCVDCADECEIDEVEEDFPFDGGGAAWRRKYLKKSENNKE